MTSAVVLVDVREAVLLITLNRPAARNAVDLEMALAVSAALDRLDDDESLRVGVLAANGPAFCGGMDLKAFARGEIPRPAPRGFGGLVEKPPRKPLIAAVEGPAVGGGFEMALACDLIVASRDARFALPEVTRGLTPNGGGLLRLPRLVPRSAATEMVFTGLPMSAERATEIGLVNRLTEPGHAVDEALALAGKIAENAPLAILAAKRVMMQCADWPADEEFARQEEIVAPVRLSADAREGARAFSEKRKPVWSGG